MGAYEFNYTSWVLLRYQTHMYSRQEGVVLPELTSRKERIECDERAERAAHVWCQAFFYLQLPAGHKRIFDTINPGLEIVKRPTMIVFYALCIGHEMALRPRQTLRLCIYACSGTISLTAVLAHAFAVNDHVPLSHAWRPVPVKSFIQQDALMK